MYPFTIMIYNRNYSDYSNIFRSNNGKEIEREFKPGQEKNSSCDWSVCIKQLLRLDWKAWQSASYRPFNFNFFSLCSKVLESREVICWKLVLASTWQNHRKIWEIIIVMVNYFKDLRPRGKRELRLTNCFHKDQNLK